MALDPVPWFVGSGAAHSAATARNLAWNATGGKTGVSTVTSLQVRQLPTPGAGVQIMPGGGTIESIYSGALQQSYTVRNDAADTLDIPVNNSTDRTYWVTVEVNDPTYAGTNPPSKKTGPYVFWRYRGVRQTTHPELMLAKIDIPAGATAITNSMITDLRNLANPRREEFVFGRPRISLDGDIHLNARNLDGGEFFPGGNGSPNIFTVPAPSWATRVMIDASWMAVRYVTGENPYGSYWIEYGDEYRNHTWPGNQQYEFITQKFSFNSPGGSNPRFNWLLMDSMPVEEKLRGTEVDFCFKAGLHAAADTGVIMDGGSGLGCRITFVEHPISADTV